MKPRQQRNNETRQEYLTAARRYCAAIFRQLEEETGCHYSHNVADAMRQTEKRFTDLGTFGEGGTCEDNGNGEPDLQYLNTGDTYEPTIVHYRGRFSVCSWGACVEDFEKRGEQ